MASARYVHTLRLLVKEEVEFVVVGMAAGILQGVPATTLDLDIVHRRTIGNVARLLRVLQTVHAVARNDDRRIAPKSKLRVLIFGCAGAQLHVDNWVHGTD